MERLFAFVYYSLATTAFSILVAREDTVIRGNIDSTPEYVWLYSVIGLGLVMFDVFVTLVNHGVRWKNGEEPKNGNPLSVSESTFALDRVARVAGSMGLYVATFMYATRNRYNVYLDRDRMERDLEPNDGATLVPYLLAFAVSILGALLSDGTKGAESGYFGIGMRRTTGGMYM
jgi:hypothetical protein